MRGLSVGQIAGGSLLRSAALLAACTAVIALFLLPFALGQTGSGGPGGLAAAAAVCLVCGWISEGLSNLVGRTGSPLAGMLVGMAVRMAPPLVICLILAANGADGRQHLAFIGYLLSFYSATLALETWLAVSRLNKNSTKTSQGAR
jgi:hypothetical protein